MNKIIVIPEFWQSNHYDIKWSYKAPDNTLWNVNAINNNVVNLWSINAWGAFQRKSINRYEFEATYKER